jgi:signal transduction histidine kinase
MESLVYIRLIGYTAGTLLQLFWMVVILGYRRQRNFERVFFFLCLALFLFYGGSLLALNAQIYYSQPPQVLTAFAWTVLSLGLCFAPALLLHIHLEYADAHSFFIVPKEESSRWKRFVLTFTYTVAVLLAVRAYPKLVSSENFDFLVPANAFGNYFGIFLTTMLAASAGWEFKFTRRTERKTERTFHVFAGIVLTASALLTIFSHVLYLHLSPRSAAISGTTLALLPIAPMAALIYGVQKYNFLQIGRQRNLMYAISVTFLGLLYLSLVRRVGALLEPVLPPEATAAVLLFVLVIFVEPIQRFLGRQLEETAQRELDRGQTLLFEIQKEARQGHFLPFVRFVENRVKERFDFQDAWIDLLEPRIAELPLRSNSQGAESFAIYQAGRLNAVLSVRHHGAMLSGETAASLKFLCEQLPGSFELCRLIEEKLLLERELAERERLAVLGQMAASISHNLKNPLGSIKTILQVQMENAELPATVRAETKMVLEEISRLSATLSQLLKFSRPAVLGAAGAATCDVCVVLEEVLGVLRHEAERRGVRLQSHIQEPSIEVAASREVVHDILSNLTLNALEATPREGSVEIRMGPADTVCEIVIVDSGSGISQELQQKILEPFFTTKTQGTGLGLAIVSRRIAEAGGEMEFQSPRENGHGTRCLVKLRLREAKK